METVAAVGPTVPAGVPVGCHTLPLPWEVVAVPPDRGSPRGEGVSGGRKRSRDHRAAGRRDRPQEGDGVMKGTWREPDRRRGPLPVTAAGRAVVGVRLPGLLRRAAGWWYRIRPGGRKFLLGDGPARTGRPRSELLAPPRLPVRTGLRSGSAATRP